MKGTVPDSKWMYKVWTSRLWFLRVCLCLYLCLCLCLLLLILLHQSSPSPSNLHPCPSTTSPFRRAVHFSREMNSRELFWRASVMQNLTEGGRLKKNPPMSSPLRYQWIVLFAGSSLRRSTSIVMIEPSVGLMEIGWINLHFWFQRYPMKKKRKVEREVAKKHTGSKPLNTWECEEMKREKRKKRKKTHLCKK